jgi:DNA-binding beta-propeller fold protein YncE
MNKLQSTGRKVKMIISRIENKKAVLLPVHFIIFLTVLNFACTKDIGKRESALTENNYPPEVGNIIVNKCATSGCHNKISKGAAAGLNLETWQDLTDGSSAGAEVIPFRPDFSTLMFYTNSFKEFGTIQLEPKMPVNGSPLTAEEMKILFEWIKNGAPHKNGKVKFQDEPDRKKFYVTNQGCDVVTVFDAKTMLATRYIDVGETRGIEAPHMIKVAPDNKHWYVSFIGGGYFQKYTAIDNKPAGKVNLGVGSWNSFVISSNSKTAYVVDWSASGKIAVVDLETMKNINYAGFNYPHGSALSSNNEFLYVTSQNGNYIYKFNVSDPANPIKIMLDNSKVPIETSNLDAHDIIFSPDHSKYFVSCQGSNELRVMSAGRDSLITIIKTGELPQEMSISKNSPYLFVSCMEDTTAGALQRGSVAVINYELNSLMKSITTGFQPHGLAVDDQNKRVYVGNRNISSGGPTPHHQGICSGRNGYITAIDLNTLNMVPGFKTEVSIDPYGLTITN